MKPNDDDQRYRLRDGIDLTRLDLTADEARVAVLLSEPITAREVGHILCCSAKEVLNVLKDVVQRGVVERVGDGRRHRVGTDAAYDGFVFPPHLMTSDCDLSEEQRKRIIYMHSTLSKLTHYELLRVRRRDDVAQIHEAFRLRSHEWHPDKWPRDKGPFNRMLQEIFSALSEARNVLADAEQRRIYDEKYGHQVVDPEDLAAMRDRARRQERDKKLAQQIKERRLQKNPYRQRKARASSFMQQSQDLETTGDLVGALRQAQTAVTYDPNNGDYKQNVERLAVKAAEQRIAPWMKRGRAAEDITKWSKAIVAYREAASMAPDYAPVHIRLAYCLYQERSDVNELRTHAHRGTELAPNDAEAQYVLALCYLRRNMKAQAKEAIERALAIRPNYADAKKLRSRLRWTL